MENVYQPTISPIVPFSAAADAQALRAAMKGLGTDEGPIIEILTHRSNAQRQDIARVFKEEFGRDLIDDLKSELGGHFEDVIVGLMFTPSEYLARELHKAMSGVGTDEHALVEILCTRSNREIKELSDTYNRVYGKPLDADLKGEVGGHFRRLLTLLVTEEREQGGAWGTHVDPNRAQADAKTLLNAGEGKLGTDEETFNNILAHQSYAQLKLVFEEYRNLTGKSIEEALKKELSGELLEGMVAIVECCQSRTTYFAKKLHEAMKGKGTQDGPLIRIIVSRSEIDLGAIKNEYERLYDKALESAIKSETGGDYKKALLAILVGHS